MKQVLVVHAGDAEFSTRLEVLGQIIQLKHLGCRGNLRRAQELLTEYDGRVSVIALVGFPVRLRLGSESLLHEIGGRLLESTKTTPVVDGSGVRTALERWGVMLAEQVQPGIFTNKRTLMVPGLNHGGLAHALSVRTSQLLYADPALFFGMPAFPGVGSPSSLPAVAAASLRRLSHLPLESFARSSTANGTRRARSLFRWAEVLAGDLPLIRDAAPRDLTRKIVVTDAARPDDLEDLRNRGALCVITLMPSLEPENPIARFSAATVEAVLTAARPDPEVWPTEDTYIDMVSQLQWQPAVRYLQTGAPDVHKFAFVIHPLHISQIHSSPRFGWSRWLPDALVESLAARIPPFRVSTITGARSPTTGQRIEGHLIALGATPKQMMSRSESFTYKRLTRAARIAERQGAKIMGLGAFTSVIGDAGVTVAQTAPIAITSGNSLTVAATLEAAKQAAIRMGFTDLKRGRAMIIGATGSIGSVCARMLAQAIHDVVLVSIEPEKLVALKRTIQQESPSAHVEVATRAQESIDGCDLIVTATSAFGQRILDISQCKPGAIICDVARPPDINDEEAGLRPDVLVIESGEVLIPGDVQFHYDIGLPPKVSYACLAETALLAMEGRFESFTLGREISIERVKEIYGLFKKHEFKLAGLRSMGRYLTDADLASKRELAERLREDPELLERTKREASSRLAQIPVRAKGVAAKSPGATRRSWLSNGLDALAVWRGRGNSGANPT